MYLHLIIESPFYTEKIIQKLNQFDSIQHTFLVFSRAEIRCISTNGENTKFKASLLKEWDAERVYIHFLSTSIASFIIRNKLLNYPIHWIMWGADFYRIPAVLPEFVLPQSKKFIRKENLLIDSIKYSINLASYKAVLRVMSHCDVFVGYEEEFEITRKRLPLDIIFTPMEYYLSLDELPNLKSPKGTDVLIGNSDDPTNNHLETIQFIAKSIPEKSKLLIPLAGASSAYIQAVEKLLKELGLQYELITDFLPLEQFFSKLEQVSHVVYGHLRQQGVGTIIPLLNSGRRLMLRPENPFYNTLKRWGVKVHSISDLDVSFFKSLQSEESIQNSKALNEVLNAKENEIRWEEILKKEVRNGLHTS